MRTTTVVIGAGQAGLATSWWLSRHSIDHVVLERGEVANSWRTERWDSLRLLTPNWQSRLPGFGYEGNDPHGFRTMAETVQFISRYAEVIAAPVRTGTTVQSLRQSDVGYEVRTDDGTWQCDTVVIASGACNIPLVPRVADCVPAGIDCLSSMHYRNPAQIRDGGVLVVGASASGTQIADELQRAGKQVTLAVGEHVRAPRVYRGRDIQWWMDKAGLLDERYDEVDDIVRARNVPSLQLAGHPDRRTVDLNALTANGVKLVGRLAGVNDGKLQLSGSLRNVCALADLKMNRLLNNLDEWAAANPVDEAIDAVQRFEATEVEASPPLLLDIQRSGIKTIIWATGFRPDYAWLDLPVLDRKGYIRHDGGVVSNAPGVYLIGMPFLRRRKSTLIDGVGDDARELSAHLLGYLRGGNAALASAAGVAVS